MDKKEKLWKSFFDYQQKEQFPRALEAIQKLEELEPKNPLIYLRIGDVYQKMKDIANAVSCYFKAADILDAEGFSNKAFAVYKMILRVDPENSAAHEKVGIAGQQVRQIPEVAGKKIESTAPAPQKEVSLFDVLSESERKELYLLAEQRTFPAGSTIVNEGDAGDSLFIVKSGNLTVVTHVMGMPIEIGDLSEGDIFGEISFLTGKPRSASVIASTDAEVMEITKDTLKKLIEKHSSINNILTGFYESRVQETIQKIKAKLNP